MATEQLNRAAFVELAFRGYVGQRALQPFGAIPKLTYCGVAGMAKKPANSACRVAVVNDQLSLPVANLAEPPLLPDKVVEGVGREPVLVLQVVLAVLGFGASLGRIRSKALRLVLDTALVALISVPVFVARALAEKCNRQASRALRACFNIESRHRIYPSLIGQRPARVDSACGLRYFNVGGA